MKARPSFFAFCAQRSGDGSAGGATSNQGGYSLSRKRISPLDPQEKGYIASLDLEELHTLRNVSAVYMASP